MEQKILVRPVHVKADTIDIQLGLATFIVSVFNNEDYGKDVVMPGAFKSAIANQKRLPKFAPNHDLSVEKKLGKVLAWREVGEGLEIDAQFNLQKQIAKEVFSDFVFDPSGQEFSFSYDIAEGGSKTEKGVRYLSNISEVMDVGPVGLGMNPRTHLVAAKEGRVFSIKNETGLRQIGDHFDQGRELVNGLLAAIGERDAPPDEAPEGKTDEPIEAKVEDPDAEFKAAFQALWAKEGAPNE